MIFSERVDCTGQSLDHLQKRKCLAMRYSADQSRWPAQSHLRFEDCSDAPSGWWLAEFVLGTLVYRLLECPNLDQTVLNRFDYIFVTI